MDAPAVLGQADAAIPEHVSGHSSFSAAVSRSIGGYVATLLFAPAPEPASGRLAATAPVVLPGGRLFGRHGGGNG